MLLGRRTSSTRITNRSHNNATSSRRNNVRHPQQQRQPPPVLHRRRRARRLDPWCSLPTVLVGVVLVASLGSVLVVSWWYGPAHRLGSSSSLENKHNHSGPNAIAVFYHIFIPSNKGQKGVRLAQQMVLEQVHQVGRAAQASGQLWTLYYTTTGDSGALDAKHAVTHAWMEHTACAKYAKHITCVANGPHLAQGYEDVTLQALYEYCQRSPVDDREQVSSSSTSASAKEQHVEGRRIRQSNQQQHKQLDNRIVIYLHSKGTYHSNFGRNEIWRQALTYAATHTSCVKALLPRPGRSSSSSNKNQSDCNVCGLQFYPVWDTMFVGNMHASQCTYVQQLLAPQHDFLQAMQGIVRDINASSTQQWTRSLYNFNNPGNIGLDRYAMEHWIASHPTIRPCDMEGDNATVFSERIEPSQSGDKVDAHAFTKYLSPSTAKARPAPRLTIAEGDWFRLPKDDRIASKLAGTTDPPHEYFLLPGLLYRHFRNYGAYPPYQSWIWSWYPSGNAWRDKIYANVTGSGVEW